MTEHSINNYYVGLLTISYPMGNLILNSINPSLSSKDYVTKRDLILQTILSGAYKTNNSHNLDYKKDIITENLLTLFYKLDDYNYLCLHNGNKYNFFGDDYCSDLTPLKEYFPKVSYVSNKKANFKDARKLFDIIFSNSGNFRYDERLYSIEDYYYGTLDLCKERSYFELEPRYPKRMIEKRESLNVPIYTILCNNKNVISSTGYSKRENDGDYYKEYYFSTFNVIFLRNKDLLYNIYDYQLYNLNDNSDEIYSTKIDLGIPLREKLTTSGIDLNSERLSISSVLSLTKNNVK